MAKIKTETIRMKPRISLNKLGEYFQATAGRRKRILKEQKHPSDFIVARYKDALAAIRELLIGECDEDTLLEKISKLSSTTAGSDFRVNDCSCSADALEAFLELYDPDEWDQFEFEGGETDSRKLIIEGVAISVRPDIILRTQDKKGNPCLGVLKLYFQKTTPLADESGKYITTVLYKHAEEHLADEDTRVCPEFCFLWDIQNRKIHKAGKAWKRRMNEVQDACAEIGDRWEHL